MRVFVDLSDTEQDERFLQLEATARNLEIELDVLHFTESERIRQLEKELNDKSVEVTTALSNVQHFFHKVGARVKKGHFSQLTVKMTLRVCDSVSSVNSLLEEHERMIRARQFRIR